MGVQKLRIANSNINYFRYPLDIFINVQKELNINAIDFWGGTPHIWIDHLGYEDCDTIKNKLLKENISLASFTPNPYNYSLLSGFETIRRENSLSYYINCIKVASYLGSPYIYLGTSGGEFDNPKELLLECYKDSLTRLLPIAEEHGIKVLITCVPKSQSKIINTLEDIKEIYDEINNDNLKILLNTHNISLVGESIDSWFSTFGKDIVHTQFIDGRYSGARIWGEGCYPLEKYLREMIQHNYSGFLGQTIDSEVYYENPEISDKKNISTLNKYLMEVKIDGFH